MMEAGRTGHRQQREPAVSHIYHRAFLGFSTWPGRGYGRCGGHLHEMVIASFALSFDLQIILRGKEEAA